MGPCVEERWTAGRTKIPSLVNLGHWKVDMVGAVNGAPCLSPRQKYRRNRL